MQISSLAGSTGSQAYAALDLTATRKQSADITTAGDIVTLSLASTDTAQLTLYTADGEIPGSFESLRQLVATLLGNLNGGDETTSAVLGVPTTDADSGNNIDWSPEATANRILSFALAWYDGGDKGEYAEMAMKAIMKGARQAAVALGGTLPQAATETISLVVQGLEEFAAGE